MKTPNFHGMFSILDKTRDAAVLCLPYALGNDFSIMIGSKEVVTVDGLQLFV